MFDIPVPCFKGIFSDVITLRTQSLLEELVKCDYQRNWLQTDQKTKITRYDHKIKLILINIYVIQCTVKIKGRLQNKQSFRLCK